MGSFGDNQNSNALPSQDAFPTTKQPTVSLNQPVENKPVNGATPEMPLGVFPTQEQQFRIQDYDYFNRLLMGDHFGAFNVRIADPQYTRDYAKLRYVQANFAALISKVCADMLFSEAPDFKTESGDQVFIDALIHENNLHVQNYESALSNSALGDAVYKIRVGKRFANDLKPTVIIEDITPTIYFPKVNGFNVRQDPNVKELAWTFKRDKITYLRKEVHTAGMVENHVYEMEGTKIVKEVGLDVLGITDIAPQQETKIDRSLVVHIPNWKTGNRYFGISDYADIDQLFYAINNRLTKTDNILDKHGDPILTVPPGVLDEKGQVQKKALGVIEVREGETGKPEYVVWDASLDAAFKELEKVVETMFMVAEISPDVLGMGQGKQDSGRAIKLKIMRTIAKVARKKLYYDRGLKEVLYIAQLVAKAWNLEVGGVKLSKDPVVVDIEWQDGLPIDNAEQVDIESKRIADGNTTLQDSIMRLDGVDEATAKKKADEIHAEAKINMPVSKIGQTPFGPNGGSNTQPPTK